MKTLFAYLIAAVLWLAASFMFLRVIGRNDYLKFGRLSIFTSIFQAAIFFLWGGFPYIYSPHDWPDVHVPPLVEILGWIGLWSGIGILFIGIGWLGLMRATGQDQTALIKEGPYRSSRNPQVIGCVLYGAGFALLWPSWYALGWALMILPVLHMMVITEEEHLAKIYNEQYRRYCERVPRYIGLRSFKPKLNA